MARPRTRRYRSNNDQAPTRESVRLQRHYAVAQPMDRRAAVTGLPYLPAQQSVHYSQSSRDRSFAEPFDIYATGDTSRVGRPVYSNTAPTSPAGWTDANGFWHDQGVYQTSSSQSQGGFSAETIDPRQIFAQDPPQWHGALSTSSQSALRIDPRANLPDYSEGFAPYHRGSQSAPAALTHGLEYYQTLQPAEPALNHGSFLPPTMVYSSNQPTFSTVYNQPPFEQQATLPTGTPSPASVIPPTGYSTATVAQLPAGHLSPEYALLSSSRTTDSRRYRDGTTTVRNPPNSSSSSTSGSSTAAFLSSPAGSVALSESFRTPTPPSGSVQLQTAPPQYISLHLLPEGFMASLQDTMTKNAETEEGRRKIDCPACELMPPTRRNPTKLVFSKRHVDEVHLNPLGLRLAKGEQFDALHSVLWMAMVALKVKRRQLNPDFRASSACRAEADRLIAQLRLPYSEREVTLEVPELWAWGVAYARKTAQEQDERKCPRCGKEYSRKSSRDRHNCVGAIVD